MGVLEGMSGLSLSRNLEIMPTVTTVQAGFRDTTGQFITDNNAEGGANVKYGITSNLTLDFTYNPDFSQIETDRPQIEVNQRFPIDYPELRPFFLEGQELFNIRAPVTPVQTRTIVDPQYGAKLTGRSVGQLWHSSSRMMKPPARWTIEMIRRLARRHRSCWRGSDTTSTRNLTSAWS